MNQTKTEHVKVYLYYNDNNYDKNVTYNVIFNIRFLEINIVRVKQFHNVHTKN